jgi:hypothetical protein
VKLRIFANYPRVAFEAALKLARYHYVLRPLAACLIPDMRRLLNYRQEVYNILHTFHQVRCHMWPEHTQKLKNIYRNDSGKCKIRAFTSQMITSSLTLTTLVRSAAIHGPWRNQFQGQVWLEFKLLPESYVFISTVLCVVSLIVGALSNPLRPSRVS